MITQNVPRSALAGIAMILAAGSPAGAQDDAAPTITADPDVLTMVNVVTPTDTTQDELAQLLTHGMEETMSRLPGFISATVHKSQDNDYVVVYAQWTDIEAVQNAGAQIAAGNAPAMAEAFTKATPEFHPYEVVSVTMAGLADRPNVEDRPGLDRRRDGASVSFADLYDAMDERCV